MLITEYRLELVTQALRTILTMEHPADTTLRYFFKNERIGSNERELVAETVFGVLRHRMLLEQACVGSSTPRRMALAHLLRFGGYNLRELEPVLKRDEKEWLATVKGVKAGELPTQAELPEWLVEKMRSHYSDADILAIGLSMQQGAPLDIRVNTLLAKREDILQQLRDKNIEAAATPYSPVGIRLREKIPLNRDALFAEGSVPTEKERLQFKGKSVQADNVSVDGDKATIAVTVTVFVDGEPNSTSVSWEAVKQGEDWKLTHAPLQ